ncbi:PBSX family phage terminase large subunit [Candidatus Fermentibacteria bacterium]|nr:MAG: PBSX family phage terminase large subunit [Candidatus Fermentibacteria bacterium]
MNQNVNEVYSSLFLNQEARYFIIMGGRGAGRSTAASQCAAAKLMGSDYFRCAIMRFALSDIRKSIFQDIRDRLEENEVDNQVKIREHLLNFQYGDNRIDGIGFRKSSSDQKSKLKSLANYNTVIIEEADETPEEDFMQLDDSLRTKKSSVSVVMLLNPPSKNHWIIRRWFNLIQAPGAPGFYIPQLKALHKKDTVFIHTSYLDNIQNITASTQRNYENYKTTNPEHYYNMIRGLVSEGARGRIFTNWKPISEAEYEALEYDEYYGLDFGFSNDPTALVGIKDHNNRVYLRELIYETGLTNPDICKKLDSVGISKQAINYADSAEPKSIKEIASDGWNIQPAVKGPDSVRAGIDMMLSKEVFYVETSKNLIKEQEEYKWALDRNKNPTNKPIDKFNHLMDASRYGVYSKSQQGFIGFV